MDSTTLTSGKYVNRRFADGSRRKRCFPAATNSVFLVALIQLASVNASFSQTPAGQQQTGNSTILGVRNVPLKDGADALLAGDWEDGVRLTHLGLAQAFGSREEEAALSNLCAGYLQLKKYETALMYCNMLLERNDGSWRGYNNRALVYIKTLQWDKAEADLIAGEEINGGAYTLKIARSMYMDAVHPVAAEIEIDDTGKKVKDSEQNR